MNDIGHWTFFKEFDYNDWVGFTYRITHIPTGRAYIGKKFFTSTTRKKVTNRTNRKKIVKESKWKSYMGSSKWLLSEIELYGKENFKFEILSLHESRSSLAYREVELLVSNNVMREKLPDGSKAFYNGLIPPIKFTVLEETIKEKEYQT